MSLPIVHFTRRALCIAVMSLSATPLAFAWTDKPVKIVVPAPPGGTMDVIARMVGDQLSADIGQPVLIENKPGAGGAIGVNALRSAPADGQTLMITASNVLTEIPHVMKTSFDPIKDIKPIAVVARAGLVFVGSPGVPAKDVKSFVAYAKANPGKLTIASYSTGTVSHYAGMILNQKAGLDLQHVPFPGSPPALVQLMGGQVTAMFDGIVTSKQYITSGKLVAYGVASAKRSPQLPDVPTMAEQGYPEINFSNWLGIVASSAMSNEMADKIHAAIVKVASNPKVRERMQAVGFEAADDLNATQLSQAVKTDFERNGAIVKQFNIQMNQ